MAKPVLPTYSICSLTETPLQPSDFMTDRLDHYLDTHLDLHFPHKHDFYHFVYFATGSGKHSIDFVPFPVKAGQVYCMAPGQVHTWEFRGKPTGYIINFSAAFLDAFLTNARFLEQFSFFSGSAAEQVIQLPAGMQQELSQVLESILKEDKAALPGHQDMLRTLLVQLFLLLNRQVTKGAQRQQSHYNSLLLRNFQQLITQHYKTKKLTKDYAALLYVTPNHLNALAKDLTGRSAGELIRDRVILEAKRLLINASLSIATIAAELDFADNSYFSKFFRKYTGTTPEAFRRDNIHNA